MTTEVVRDGPHARVDLLARRLLEHRVGSIIIDDATGRSVGLVTESQLLGWAVGAAGRPSGTRDSHGTMDSGFFADGRPIAVAEDLMTPLRFFVTEEAPVVFAAALMAYEMISQLPVMNVVGRAVGMVTAQDIVAVVAAGSGYVVGSHSERRARTLRGHRS